MLAVDKGCVFTESPSQIAQNAAHRTSDTKATFMVHDEVPGQETEKPPSVAQYRFRAYRDGLIIIVFAILSYIVLVRVNLGGYIISWIEHLRRWEFDVLASIIVVFIFGLFVFVARRRRELLGELRERTKLQEEQGRLIKELEEMLSQVKTLTGLLPMCSWCKKVRDDRGYWAQVEDYLQRHSNAKFTHGVCPDCAEKFRKEARTKSRG